MKNKVTIIGNGGREDSLRWKLRQEGVEIMVVSTYSAQDYLTVIGPEAPIAEGLTDELESKNIPVFGPSKLAGQLETSKVWAKEFMQRHGIPTANWTTHSREDIEDAILENCIKESKTFKNYLDEIWTQGRQTQGQNIPTIKSQPPKDPTAQTVKGQELDAEEEEQTGEPVGKGTVTFTNDKGEVEKEVGATTGTRRRMARQSPGVNVRSIG